MAKYRRPIQTFDTISTIPAAASLQAVPPPSTSTNGVRKAVPIPAMITPTSEVEKVGVKEGDKEMIVQGVVIPPKPVPPKDDGMSFFLKLGRVELMVECCMNSCVNCVYNLYADDLENYTSSLSSAHIALVSASIPKSEWPEAVRRLDGKNGKEGMKKEEMGKMEDGMDPVVLAFLDMERRLKKKQLDRSGS